MSFGGKAIANGKCATQCIVQSSGTVPSAACSWCYAEYDGLCAFDNCLGACALDLLAPECVSCVAINCAGKLEACKSGF